MTVSDVLAPPATATTEKKGAGARARVRANTSVTESDSSRASRVRSVVSTVADDFQAAWLWDANGITVRALWDNRVVDTDQVPGGARVLQAAWTVFNHVALLVLVPLLFAAWVLCHPARLLYAAPLAVPLTLLWLS